jgi:hypothetical protein
VVFSDPRRYSADWAAALADEQRDEARQHHKNGEATAE